MKDSDAFSEPVILPRVGDTTILTWHFAEGKVDVFIRGESDNRISLAVEAGGSERDRSIKRAFEEPPSDEQTIAFANEWIRRLREVILDAERRQGKVLVDREALREALEESFVYCAWPDCGWHPPDDPHSNTCPLATSEPDEPHSPPGGAD